MGKLKHVAITVTNGMVEAHPDPVYIGRKALEEVCWHSLQGEASVNFNDSPFTSDHFLVPRRGSVAAGPATGETGEFKYSIIVRIPGDRREYVVDPRVIVEE